jgi:hypothetical protein
MREYNTLLTALKKKVGFEKFTEEQRNTFFDEIAKHNPKDNITIEGLRDYIKEKYSEKELQTLENSTKKTHKPKKNEDDEDIEYTSLILFDGKMAEQCYDKEKGTSFYYVYNPVDQSITKEKEIIVDGIKHRPINAEELEREVVLLPSELEKYEDINSLINEIRDFIREYYDCEDKYLTISAWYVLLTWVYDRLNTINYLRALGDFGTGKSRFLDAVGRICYKPIVGSGAGTVAALKRMVNKWRGTVLTDEGDFRGDDEKNEIVKFYNLGFEKHRSIYQCNKLDPTVVEFYSPFCPKIITTRKYFKDQALESRCLTHITRTTDRDIPVILPSKFFKKQEELRNKLLKFRFDYYFNIDPDNVMSLDLGNIEPRLKQATISFASLFANIPEAFDDFKEFLVKYQIELIENRASSFDGEIINTIVNLMVEDGVEIITPQMIADKMDENGMNTTSRTIGKHLKGIGIETKRSKIEGKTKNIILITNEFQKLVKKYVPDAEKVTLVTKVTTVMLSSMENQKKNMQKNTLPDNITDVTNVTNVTFGSKEVPQETKVKIEEISDFEADFPLEGANQKKFRKVEPTHLPCSSCGAVHSKGWTLEDRQGKIYCDICAGVEI